MKRNPFKGFGSGDNARKAADFPMWNILIVLRGTLYNIVTYYILCKVAKYVGSFDAKIVGENAKIVVKKRLTT